MKRWFTILLPLLLVGCVNSNEQNDAPLVVEQIPEQITVQFEQPSSRTMVQEDRYICWTEGDEISYFPHQNVNLQYRLQSVDGETAKFTRISTPDASSEKLDLGYAVYPYAENVAVLANGDVKVQLPAMQHYAEESFGVGATTMVAV